MIKRVRITSIILVDDERGLDINNPNTYNITLLDRENDDVIFDVQLKRKGEKAFRPEVLVWVE
jgi:hypothetical protein